MAAPVRRTTQSVPRANPNSIEYWKSENQKLRERNQSLHRRLHKYKNFVCTLQDDKRKFTFIHKGHRYEFPRLLILARSLADALGTTGQHPENIPPPNDVDPGNPIYSFDTSDIFPDFDPTTFHIFLQMLSRFCIYKPESIDVDRIKQIWRISDYFDIPTLLLNEEDLVNKIRNDHMKTFAGIQKELDFAMRYNWQALKVMGILVLREKTMDMGGLIDNMRDAEIMRLLDTLVVAERRKSGVAQKEDDEMSGDGFGGVKWSTPSDNENGEMNDEREDSAIADETTMDLVVLD